MPLTLDPPRASTTRREFIAMVAAASVLAGCGDDNRGSASGADSGGSGTRTVRTDNGTAEVPKDPKRVVAAIGSFETTWSPSASSPC